MLLVYQKTGTWDPSGILQKPEKRDLGTLVGHYKKRKTGMWDEWVDCKCIEFVAAGCCTRKWLRFNQTIRNLASGDLGILLVVSRLGVTRLKKNRVVYLWDLFEWRGENGQCDLVRAKRLEIIGLMVVMVISHSRVVNVVLVLWGVGPILRNGYGVYLQKVCWSKMSAGQHSRNLI